MQAAIKENPALAAVESNEDGEEEEEATPIVMALTLDEMMKTITDDIVNRALDEGNPPRTLSALLTTREILDELMAGTERNCELREAYAKKVRTHNQLELFNLLNYILDFNIDEDMYKALAFRESLVISKASIDDDDDENDVNDDDDDDNAAAAAAPPPSSMGRRVKLTPVGGMCVNVTEAKGLQPIERQMEHYEAKLMKLLDAEGLTDHIGSGAQKVEFCEDELSLQNEYGHGKFLVHCTSQIEVDGSNAGSSTTAWVDRNLHTLEELRKEYVEEEEFVNERSLYMALKKNWYYVKHTSSTDDRDERKLYSLKKAKRYLSEGASFLLMRYLAIRRYFGKFELGCAYINGDLCRNIYECFGPESDIFNGKKLDCCTIKRTVIEECGLAHESMTILTLHGQILKHEWSDCDYVLHMNPLANLSNDKPKCNEDLSLAENWTKDMQLMSEYLDHKQACLMQAKTYDYDHPDLRQIIADYVNTILQMRPPDVRDFTFNYFGSFVSTELPRNEYFE